MTSRLNPYLAFGDTARAAMEFYQSVLGGELALNTYASMGQGDGPQADLIMHSQLETPLGFTLMASDMTEERGGATANSAISLSGDDADELRGYFAGLADGGQVQVPLAPQMWGDEFGMVTDRFGIQWMVNISAPRA